MAPSLRSRSSPARSTKTSPAARTRMTPQRTAKASAKSPASAARNKIPRTPPPAEEAEEDAAEEDEDEEDEDEDEDAPLFFHSGQAGGASEDDDDEEEVAGDGEEDADAGFVLDTTPAAPTDAVVRVEWSDDDGGGVDEIPAADYAAALHAAVLSAKVEKARLLGLAAEARLDRAYVDEGADEDEVEDESEEEGDSEDEEERLEPYLDHEAAAFRPGAVDRSGGLVEVDAAKAAARPLSKRERRDARAATAGPGWFDMPAAEVTRASKDDARAYAHRAYVDPKRFYKKTDKLSPFAAVGTVIAGAFERKAQTLTRRERKQTLVAELLADSDVRSYTKRKYQQIQTKKRMPARKKRASAKIVARRQKKK